MALTITCSEYLDDWYVLTDENGRDEYSGGAIVEGTAGEWLAIADAIEAGRGESFRRCAARRGTHYWTFSSPRNSCSDDHKPMLFDDEAPAFVATVRNMLLVQCGDGI
jgi:hypothetical protein